MSTQTTSVLIQSSFISVVLVNYNKTEGNIHLTSVDRIRKSECYFWEFFWEHIMHAQLIPLLLCVIVFKPECVKTLWFKQIEQTVEHMKLKIQGWWSQLSDHKLTWKQHTDYIKFQSGQ